MALLDSKQLNPKFTGSFTLSGSEQSFIGSSNFTGSVGVSGDVTASSYSGVFVGALSSSAQISDDISGSFSVASASFSSRVTLTEATASSLVTASGSFSTRLTTAETELENTLISSSVQIASDITGSWTPSSASFSTRITTAESELENTLISSSVQIASDVTGSWTPSSASFSSRTTTIEGSGGIQGVGTSNSPTFAGLTATGDITTTGDVIAENYIVSSSVTYLTQSFSSGSTIFGDSIDDMHHFTGSSDFSGSITATSPETGSTTIIATNMQNGYPTSNFWGENLEGSYFNNFDNTTHVSEILRFMSGVLSSSLDVADASPNAKTWASLTTSENNKGSTDSVDGYLPQSYNDSNATLKYLVTKNWISQGAPAFNSISVYHDNGPTYYVDFDSVVNDANLVTVSSSADAQLFGLGGLTSGTATQFDTRICATQSFSDTGSITTPTTASNTFTTQSQFDVSMTSFGTSNGVSLAKINTTQPAVIPAAYQD